MNRVLCCCLAILLVVSLPLMMACDKSKLGKILSATNRIERAVPRLDNLLVQFAANGTIDATKANEFRNILLKIKKTAHEVNTKGRDFKELTGDAKTQVMGLLRLVAAGLGSLNGAGLFIKNPKSQNQFTVFLTVALLALDDIEDAIGEPIRSPPTEGSP